MEGSEYTNTHILRGPCGKRFYLVHRNNKSMKKVDFLKICENDLFKDFAFDPMRRVDFKTIYDETNQYFRVNGLVYDPTKHDGSFIFLLIHYMANKYEIT